MLALCLCFARAFGRSTKRHSPVRTLAAIRAAMEYDQDILSASASWVDCATSEKRRIDDVVLAALCKLNGQEISSEVVEPKCYHSAYCK